MVGQTIVLMWFGRLNKRCSSFEGFADGLAVPGSVSASPRGAVVRKSPWLEDAAVGVTGQTFEIRTIQDFLKVPEERRRICLREFDVWLSMQVSVPALIHAAANAIGQPLSPTAIQLREPDVFRWIDDGKATIGVTLVERDQTEP